MYYGGPLSGQEATKDHRARWSKFRTERGLRLPAVEGEKRMRPGRRCYCRAGYKLVALGEGQAYMWIASLVDKRARQ